MAQKKITVLTIQDAANGFIVRKSSEQHVFKTVKELQDFIGEQYRPEPAPPKE